MKNTITFNKSRFIVLLIAGFTVFTVSQAYAQCTAGTDAEIKICDLQDDKAPEGKLNLFGLIGEYTPGGRWYADPENSGLDRDTGILNILAIKKSGEHIYTYKITCPDGTENTAKVTLLLGSFLREGVNGSVCNSRSDVNLFEFLTAEEPGPEFNSHNNGIWRSESEDVTINGPIFNATQVALELNDPPKTFRFTYTLPAVGTTCLEKTTSFTLKVYRAPKPGELNDSRVNQPFCETDNLSAYTAVNLFDLIDNEDPDGIWSEPSGTDQLENPSDSTINLQDILTKHGPGTYIFRYTVTGPTVCGEDSVDVTIVFKPSIDLDALSLEITPNICIDSDDFDTIDFQGILKPKEDSSTLVPDGDYTIRYTAGSTTVKEQQLTFRGGHAVFSVDKSDLSLTGNHTVTILSITNEDTCATSKGSLQAELVLSPIPDNLEGTTLLVNAVCLGEDPVITSNNTQLLNGTYIFTYNLTGSNETIGEKTDTVTVTDGHFSFTIPAALVPRPGATTIRITDIEDANAGCSTAASANAFVAFTLYEPIDFTNAEMALSTANICLDDLNQPGFNITVTIKQPQDADPVPDGTYTITYTIGTDPFTATVTFRNGQTTFPIDTSTMDPDNPSTYNFEITSIKGGDANNPCENPVNGTALEINTYQNPDIEGLEMNVDLNCVVGQPYEEVKVTLTGASELADGLYTITYNLSGRNTISNQVVTVTLTGGNAEFLVDPELIPNTGKTTLTLTNIINEGAVCSTNLTEPDFTSEFETHPTINIDQILLTVNNNGVSCQDTDLNVMLSGLDILTDITVTYALSGANNTITDQILPSTVSGGIALFTIDKTLLPNTGITTLTIIAIQNDTEHCPTEFPTFPQQDITIAEKPIIPQVPPMTVEYCSEERRTLNDLNTEMSNLNPESYSFLWFNDISDTTPLPINTLLVQGTYWVAQANIAGCLSDKTAVNVIIHLVAVPVLPAEGENFCGLEQPTVADLDQKVPTDDEINWFDAELGGNLIAKNELLQEGRTYYGFALSEVTQCMSEKPLIVTVSLTNCDAEDHDFFIPDAFSPDGNGINDTFKIPKIDYIYPNYTIEIFNRYGNILYKGNKNTPPWDGRNHYATGTGSGIVPNGVYFYILNYNKGNKPPKQGYLYLNR